MVAATTPPATATPPSASTLTASSGQVLARWGLLERPHLAAGPRGARVDPCRPCHLRATPDGQSRYPADNHGHCHPSMSWFSFPLPARTHPANMPDKDEVAARIGLVVPGRGR